MSTKYAINIGDRFGKLVAVQDLKGGRWQFLCDCGRETTPFVSNVVRGLTRSCGKSGCRPSKPKDETLTGKSEYKIWQGIKQRCFDLHNKSYSDYGGRGIKVCDRWLYSFDNFLTDMGRRPSGMEIERVDNDGDYCPENCIWADRTTQANNKRNNRLLTYNGKSQTIAQWANETKIPYFTLMRRVVNGWSPERALTEPIKEVGKLIEWNGKSQTLKEWAKELGIPCKRLSSRLFERGWSIERTLTEPLVTSQERLRLLTHDGKTQSIAAWEREKGYKTDTIRLRLNKNGWTVEQAIETPVRRRSPNQNRQASSQ